VPARPLQHLNELRQDREHHGNAEVHREHRRGHGQHRGRVDGIEHSLPERLLRGSDLTHGAFLLLHQECNQDTSGKENAAGYGKGEAEAQCIGYQAPAERPERGTKIDRRLHDSQAESEALLGDLRGYERLRRGDRPGEDALQHAQSQQLVHVLNQGREADQHGCREGSTHQHNLPAMSVGQHSPDRR